MCIAARLSVPQSVIEARFVKVLFLEMFIFFCYQKTTGWYRTIPLFERLDARRATLLPLAFRPGPGSKRERETDRAPLG